MKHSMDRMKRTVLAVAGIAAGLLASARADEPVKADVVVYAGTPAGITAAIAAAREGRTVSLVELNNRVGGMISGGLTNTDIGKRWTVGGLSEEFLTRVVGYYAEKYGPDSEQYKACKNGRKYEPHVAELIFERMLAEQPKIKVWKGHRYHSVTLDGARIVSLTAEDPVAKKQLTFKGDVFIDASYTGDVMAGALVPYRVGREGRAEFGEPLAGVTKGPESVIGTGDHRTQAYNYRVSITGTTANRVLFPKPGNYDPEPWRAKFQDKILSGKITKFLDLYISKAGANDKRDSNWNDLVGGNEGYAEGDWETRAKIEAKHRDYYLSMLYYLQNDPALPESFRKDAMNWGLPKDEFQDTGHFPFQLYIRESRRMLGKYILREQDLTENRQKADGICAGNYGIDCHGVQFTMVNGKRIIERTRHRSVEPYDIPYSSIVPIEPGNLIVPVCLSSTHVAYCSLRMEPVFMMIGHAAGKVAHLALAGKTSVQDVDVAKLRELLLKEGAVLDAAAPGKSEEMKKKAKPGDDEESEETEMEDEAPAKTPAKQSKETKEEKKPAKAKKEAPAADTVVEDPALPRVLIIGDSISIGYTPGVRELLKGKANVLRIPGNGSSTSHGLANLGKWLGDAKWDVIHFNFGLHDAKLPPEGIRHSEPEQYEKNLRELVKQLQATGAKLIFATTTPVPDGGNLAPDRRFAEVKAYNEAALRVMKENNVTINDLNTAMQPHAAEYLRPKDVHYTKEGSAFLADRVAAAIGGKLKQP
ncbi:FAD-dependent oxidoreductase [Luteolibacter sp. SL250]|uniref:FAD-dependent oxidoreductase n=1 Tax=Luteolibacter sp. SL250 TaxID=2995170 RepID=UPI00226DD0FF|nr:FAD-dependent oxidoreductase [Luteolibacter sp. SL250]WAC18554.1 FAD-dependent oxidoreductase [Luteolibacter sp. SL250]